MFSTSSFWQCRFVSFSFALSSDLLLLLLLLFKTVSFVIFLLPTAKNVVDSG